MWASLLLGAVLMGLPVSRERTCFDDEWRFALGNAADPDKDFGYGREGSFLKAGESGGPAGAGFDDSGWRHVDLPHDWAVELPFVQNDHGLHTQHGSHPIGRMYPETCIGWYRKAFDVPASDLGRRVSLEFDGVFRDSMVWVNGHYIGRHLSGYTGFGFDVSDYLNYGGQNSVTVRVDASQYEGWFYEGAGIYRHTWLTKTSPVHIAKNSIYVRPSVSDGEGSLTVTGSVENKGGTVANIVVFFKVFDPKGDVVAKEKLESQPVYPGASAEVGRALTVAGPQLWDIDHPNLYRIEVNLVENGQETDTLTTTFGFRTVVFDKDRGVILNGRPVKIRGACDHQDHAGVGTAIPDRLNAWRIEQLKKYGFNALRTSHNAPTPELLDACDRLGFLVLDENRLMGSSEAILDEVRNLVTRDRNHPCVIAWSIGNEEGVATSEVGGRIAKKMMDTVKGLDFTRPCTYASNAGNNPNGTNAIIDLRGFNYKNISDLDKYRKEHPDQFLWGTEEASALSTRGEYSNDKVKGYMSSYDVNQPGWGATAEDWLSFFEARDWLAGAFVWTGFDYRGEPTPYGWPCISSHFGVLDTCGFPKDTAYYYQAWWTNEPVLHILPHWNWAGKEGQPIDVWVHSNLEEVELFANGKSLGRKSMPKHGHFEWKVPYEPGALKADGYRGGKKVKVAGVSTTQAASILRLESDRDAIAADGKDVAVVTVSGFDPTGLLDPVASKSVTFEIQGEGKIIGVGNGDPSCHEPDKFFSEPVTRALTDWRWSYIDQSSKGDWKSVGYDDSGWKASSVLRDGQDMKPGTLAVYRTTFDLSASELKEGPVMGIGQIDDEGWVFVNGVELLQTKDWNKNWTVPLSGHLKAGKNVVAIMVKNNGGGGGLGRGVRLSFPAPPVVWKRSLFHGLAQVIVQSTRKPGQIVLRAEADGMRTAELVVKTAK